jgi:hypothetical protein
MIDNKVNYIKKIIPDDLWKKARAAALTENKTISEWITEAIKEKLNHKGNNDKARLALPSDNY